MTELGYRLRETFRRYIRQFGSVDDAAKKIGIGRSTLYQYLAGDTDPGLECVLGWAAKLGWDAKAWIQSTGLFPLFGPYSDLLRATLDLGKYPADPLIRSCSTVARKLEKNQLELASANPLLIQIEDTYFENCALAQELSRGLLRSSVKSLRKRSSSSSPPADESAQFFSLIAMYGFTCYSRNASEEWAWSLVLSFEYFQRWQPNPTLTWLLMDASMLFRRFLQAREALDLASLALAFSARQDTVRLYPRALFTLAAILFNIGESEEANQLHHLVLSTPSDNPYKPLAAYSRAVELSETDPCQALELLHEHRDALDSLPAYRQVKRYWAEARTFRAMGERDQAFEAFKKAFFSDEKNCDPRDLFLIFEEAQILVGVYDKRLVPFAAVLWGNLERLSHQPGAFLILKGYLDYLAENNAAGMKRQIERLKEFETSPSR